jgi:D-serine deaminase-like pyridoxal phosphate-dependent protein
MNAVEIEEAISTLAEQPFEWAALLITRVISIPAPDMICVDLGNKSVASENPQPRVFFLNAPDAVPTTHSEEHLVIETNRSTEFQVGDCLYGVPWHICPTVALHSEAAVIDRGKIVDRWKVAARERRLTI